MAVTHDLVELFQERDSTEASGFVRGEWSQNLWNFDDSVRVRPGFGQIAELDTTLSLNTSTSVIGYETHLGSAAIETTFGHQQILSVFSGKCSTSNIAGEITPTAEWANLYFVRIYDVTTDKSYEEVLYRFTGELAPSGNTYPMSLWLGNYDTDMSQDNANFLTGQDSEFFFEHVDGALYFGSRNTGIYAYLPSDFRGTRSQWLRKSELIEYSPGYSESSIITRISFVSGSYSDRYIYLKDTDLSRISDVAVFNGRFVYSSEREVYFSDVNKPNSVMAVNVISVPSKTNITALASIRDVLVIFTEDEVFHYTPSGGALASQGRTIRASETLGTFSPNTVIKARESLIFVSEGGVYATSDGLRFDELSGGISNFFTEVGNVTSPLTSFFETEPYSAAKPHSEGFDNLNNEQPRTLIRFDKKKVSLAYSSRTKTLLLSVPEINGLWAFKGGWSYWPLESVAKVAGGSPVVGVEKNLLNPWVLSMDGDFFLTVGTDTQQLADQGTSHAAQLNAGSPQAINATTRSYALLRLGLGGALDRSCNHEDYRRFPQRYLADKIDTTNTGVSNRQNQGIFYLREPIYDRSDGGYWIPLEVLPPESLGATINAYGFRVKFDTANYTANSNPVTGAVTLKLPPERIGTASNVSCFTSNSGGVVSPTGDHLNIIFTGATISLARKNSNPLLFFKLTPLNGNTTSSFGFQTVLSAMYDSAGVSADLNVYAYSPYKVDSEKKVSNARAQAVDWAFKSSQKGNANSLVRARGLFNKIASRGAGLAADDLLADGWLWGVFNVILGSDQKQYSTQVIDIGSQELNPNITKVVNKDSLRSRYRKMNGDLAKRTFGGGPVWGVQANQNTGNYLIDDPQIDNIVISDSTKGEELSYLAFGFMRSRGESLIIISMMADIYQLGRRRRTGR